MVRLRPLIASSLAWSVGAVTAAAVGLLALSLIRTGLGEDASLPPTPDVASQLEATPTSPPTTGTGPAPVTSAPGPAKPAQSAERTVTTIGGTLVATCRADQAYLVYWTPAPAFRTDEVTRGPAPVARVTFHGENREIKVSVLCIGGVPQPDVHEEWDDDGHD